MSYQDYPEAGGSTLKKFWGPIIDRYKEDLLAMRGLTIEKEDNKEENENEQESDNICKK